MIYRYTTGLINDVLFRVGENTDGTSDFNSQGLQYLNRAYEMVWLGGRELDPAIQEDWYWLEKQPPGTLTLQPTVTGTVSVTRGSKTITFSAAPSPTIDKSLASGWFFRITGDADLFRIASHASGATAATLDSVYTGQTATAAKFSAYKLQYPLATDVMRLVSPMRVYQQNQPEISIIDEASLDRDWPLTDLQTGVPQAAAQIGPLGRTVRFSHAMATGLARVEVPYLRQPAALTTGTLEEPAVPLWHRSVLSDAASYLLFVDKNDNRADTAGLLAKNTLRSMAAENRYRKQVGDRQNGTIITRPGQLTTRGRGPLRTQTGLIIG